MEDLPGSTNSEILLDSETIAGYQVKPWTISKCAALTPAFEKIAAGLKERHLSFRDFFVIAKKDGKDTVEVMNLDQLLFTIMPYVPEILATTLDLKMEDVDKIKQDAALLLIMTIAKQNIEYLKNLFALMLGVMRALKTA